MPTTFIIDKNSHLFKSNQLEKTEKRLKQYQQGIDKIVELNKNYNLDIYIADNGHNFDDKIKIPECVKVIKNNPNKLGSFNKGSGIIEIWNNNIEILKQYDYIIHFEPRQLLIDNYFIDNFMKNPRTLFTMNVNFTDGTGSYAGNTTTVGVTGLNGNITLDNTTGELSGTNLVLSGSLGGLDLTGKTATLVGNFHGDGATDVSGIFFTDNLDFAGGFLGNR